MLQDVDKETINKARKRIKRQFLTGLKEPRVKVLEGKKGVYIFKHHVNEVEFRVDALGRAYFI
jgi:hypothetical protein